MKLIGDIPFLYPQMLYAGIAVSIFTAMIFAFERKRRKKLLAKFASARLLPQIARTTSAPKEIFKATLFTLGVFFIFAALARPQWGYRWEETKSRGVDVVFAIDTSKSMLAEDVLPDRLERAKLAVLDMISKLGSDRIGLVAFSGQSFLQCPLTLDYDAFKMSLEALDTSIIQRGGTNIAAAISEAETAFADTSNHKIVVLISDGEELEASAVAKAKEAQKNGVVIFALGVGGASGEPIPVRDENGRLEYLKDENGKLVSSRLNEGVLGEIAEATGGFYAKLSSVAVGEVYDAIKKIPQEEMSTRMRQFAIERFQFPLAAAIILLGMGSLVGNRKFFVPKRGNASTTPLAVIAFALIVLGADRTTAQEANLQSPNFPANANIAKNAVDTPVEIEKAEGASDAKTTDGEGKDAKKEAKPLTQIEKTRALFNGGIEDYKKGDYETAVSMFEEAIKSSDDLSIHSKAFHNIGDAYYKLAEKSLSDCETAEDAKGKIEAIKSGVSQNLLAGTEILKEGLKRLDEENKMLADAAKNQEKLIAPSASNTSPQNEAQAKAEGAPLQGSSTLSDEQKKQLLEKSPLKEQQFQQSLKQQISQMEALEKSAKESSDKLSKNDEGSLASSAWEHAKDLISKADDNFKNALELNPDFAESAKNEKTTRGVKSKIFQDAESYNNIIKSLNAPTEKKKFERLSKVKEALKKLVRDEQNQNQDKNQNQQDQQNQQQNQDKQNQDKQDNQQQNQDQNSQQNQDKQNQEQNENQKNEHKNQDEQKQNQNQQNKEDQKKSEQQKQEQQKSDEKDKSSDNADNNEQKKNEQAVDYAKEKEREQDSAKKDSAKSEEQKEKENELASAREAQEKKDEQKNVASAEEREKADENYRKAEGFMTRREAKELLESMHDTEKRLPLSGFGEQKNRYEQNYKDW